MDGCAVVLFLSSSVTASWEWFVLFPPCCGVLGCGEGVGGIVDESPCLVTASEVVWGSRSPDPEPDVARSSSSLLGSVVLSLVASVGVLVSLISGRAVGSGGGILDGAHVWFFVELYS